jgi:hypothetical protein
LRKALEHITAHPEEWDQDQWAARGIVCGTSCCLAGTIALQQGYAFDFHPIGGGQASASYATKDGLSAYIPYAAAAELLGCRVEDIRGGVAEYPAIRAMFRGTNDLGTLWRHANALTDGEIQVPEEFL